MSADPSCPQCHGSGSYYWWGRPHECLPCRDREDEAPKKTLTIHPFNHAGQYRGMFAKDGEEVVFTATIGVYGQDFDECFRYARLFGFDGVLIEPDLVEVVQDDTAQEIQRISELPGLVPEAKRLAEMALAVQRGEMTLHEACDSLHPTPEAQLLTHHNL